jgi:hypothetical protein
MQFLRSWSFKDVGIVCGMYRRFDERVLMVFEYGGEALPSISTIQSFLFMVSIGL